MTWPFGFVACCEHRQLCESLGGPAQVYKLAGAVMANLAAQEAVKEASRELMTEGAPAGACFAVQCGAAAVARLQREHVLWCRSPERAKGKGDKNELWASLFQAVRAGLVTKVKSGNIPSSPAPYIPQLSKMFPVQVTWRGCPEVVLLAASMAKAQMAFCILIHN